MENEHEKEIPAAAEAEAYEPPRVDEVLTAEELEREVHYAGVPVGSPVMPG